MTAENCCQVLCISNKPAFCDALTAALPHPAALHRADSPAQAKNYIAVSPAAGLDSTVLIVDATQHPQHVAGCAAPEFGNIPIIAVIARPEQRQAVLAAGAADYLLWPLLAAEVETRLKTGLHQPLKIAGSILECIWQNGHKLPNPRLNQQLAQLADSFDASCAWLLLTPPDHPPGLAGCYNMPPQFQPDSPELIAGVKAWLKEFRQADKGLPRLTEHPAAYSGCSHCLAVPLTSARRLPPVGLLNLGYLSPPRLNRLQNQLLTFLGQSLGTVLDALALQQETQWHAAQNVFMVLLARLISTRHNLKTVLSLTLEQVIPLLNARGGVIWLMSADGRRLELTSSLMTGLPRTVLTHRLAGAGLIGWVAHHNHPLLIQIPTTDPRFDPNLDTLPGISGYSLLAIPLHHQDATIGVLAVYGSGSSSFSRQDMSMLEGIGSLTASAVATARLVQELRDYANQQHTLYEMSQQIAGGLDFQTTLDRTLQWANRLTETEIGLLWLLEPQENSQTPGLRLAAATGLSLPADAPVTMPLSRGICGQVAGNSQAVLLNNVTTDTQFDPTVGYRLNFRPRSLMAAPLMARGQVCGVIEVLNKSGGPFTLADLTLLCTAVEMAAIAISNARLHTQTVSLVHKIEQLHRQMLQTERLATVGRLTANLSHEINNPMQAIQGAVALALEELHNPTDLAEYLHLCLRESDRVVQLLSRMRQIYRPQPDTQEKVNLNDLLHEVTGLARKELNRQKISLQTSFAPNTPPLSAVVNQLHLVFLSLLLNICDTMGAAGGGVLQLCSFARAPFVWVEFLADCAAPPPAVWLNQFAPLNAAGKPPQNLSETSLGFGLSFSQDIILAHHGAIEFAYAQQQLRCLIKLPMDT
jgi:GAF domain-containing protein